MPQVPNDFDCLTMVSLMGARTSRIELGTAVVPLQAQHPIALARQALSVHAGIGGRLALGVGPSHHWIVRDMLGIPYEKPAAYTRDYLEVLTKATCPPLMVTMRAADLGRTYRECDTWRQAVLARLADSRAAVPAARNDRRPKAIRCS